MKRRFGSLPNHLLRRRLATVAVLSAVVVLGLGAFVLEGRSAPVEHRQIVVLVLDAARRDAFSCYGNPRGTTPECDALARDGVRFDHAISQASWTLPSMASLLTGTWPAVHGAGGRDVHLRAIREGVPTVAGGLRDAGIHTMGYANAAFFSPLLGVDRGFDLFDHCYTFNGNYRRGNDTVDAVLGGLGENRHRRNFVVVHLFDPHLDYGAPSPWRFLHTDGRTEPAPPLGPEAVEALGEGDERPSPTSPNVTYARGLYLGEVSFADAQVGRVLKRLKALGMYDESVIVVTADHGEEFWDHGGFEHGHSLYDELVRVPLIVKYPKSAGFSGRVIESQVRLLDLAPTFFEFAGVAPPESFVGSSLTPVVAGAETADRDAWSESMLYGPDRTSLRTGDYVYVLTRSPEGGIVDELYDRHRDPAERKDLARAKPEVVRELRERVLAREAKLREQTRRLPLPEEVYLGEDRVNMLRALGYYR